MTDLWQESYANRELSGLSLDIASYGTETRQGNAEQ